MEEFSIGNLYDEALKFPDFMTISVYISAKCNISYIRGPVYHYTDINGFKGILENHCFWASNIRFMNDSEEFEDGLSLCNNVIDSLLGDEKNEENRKYFNVLRTVLNKDYAGRISNEFSNNDIFVICFCTNGDLLSQWRGYGKGSGISIGFDASSLWGLNFADKTVYDTIINDKKEANLQTIPTFLRGMLKRVVYDKTEKISIIKEIIDIGLKSEFPNPSSKAEANAEGVASALKPLIPLFKNSSFEEEKECRFIWHFGKLSKGNPKIFFREKNAILLPYIQLKMLDYNSMALKYLPIKDIVVGPGKNQNHTIESIKYFLNKNGFEYLSDKVRPSSIPYRE